MTALNMAKPNQLKEEGNRRFQAGDYVMWTGVAISALAATVMFTRRRGFLSGSAGAADGHAAKCEADTGQPIAG